jgi:hypothetical protein
MICNKNIIFTANCLPSGICIIKIRLIVAVLFRLKVSSRNTHYKNNLTISSL